MRGLFAKFVLALATFASAERILLVPLDSRPAAGQFADMIAKIGAVDVRFPPYGSLGKFTTPGKPEEILDWLEKQDLSDVTAVIISTDMIAYGGLVASREPSVPRALAEKRIGRLESWRAKNPRVPLYMFCSTMRLAPTATRATNAWRMSLARHEELREKVQRGQASGAERANMVQALRRIPAGQLQAYRAARLRDHEIQKRLIRMTAGGGADYLIVGQDDARLYGPHVPETKVLKKLTADLNAGDRVAFVEGIDQHASVLVSRALMKRHGWTPKIRIVASDPAGLKRAAIYESLPLETTIEAQIRASGAEPVTVEGTDDFSLYVNTPKPGQSEFESWVSRMNEEIDQGFPVAVADVNFGADGAMDPVLFATLSEKTRFARLLSFAGWNTAGNTIGTAVPAACVYLLARRRGLDPVVTETAQKEFLLHRVANDYAYHKTTRPTAYRILEDFDKISRDETDGTRLEGITDFVRRDLRSQVQRLFQEQFLGRPFTAGGRRYAISALDDVQVWLPWPRVYEVRLQFSLQARSLDD